MVILAAVASAKVIAVHCSLIRSPGHQVLLMNLRGIRYVLIDGVNDSDSTAHELGELLANRAVVCNVIPYNPTNVPHDYKRPSQVVVDRFNKIVREYGVRTIQRQELGQDISGACGQLVIESMGGMPDAPAPGGVAVGSCGPAGSTGDLEDLCGPGSASAATGRSNGSAVAAKATVKRAANREDHVKGRRQTTGSKSMANTVANGAGEGPMLDLYSFVWAVIFLGLALLLYRVVPRLLR